MPVKRRQELLAWAYQQENRYLIEDDYDSEFRYKGKPIPALQGMDDRVGVIYCGTFSKSIAPAIRVSYVVLPIPLYQIYQKRISFLLPRYQELIRTYCISSCQRDIMSVI